MFDIKQIAPGSGKASSCVGFTSATAAVLVSIKANQYKDRDRAAGGIGLDYGCRNLINEAGINLSVEIALRLLKGTSDHFQRRIRDKQPQEDELALNIAGPRKIAARRFTQRCVFEQAPRQSLPALWRSGRRPGQAAQENSNGFD